MKRIIFTLLFIHTIWSLSAQPPRKIVLLYTNDMHSRLTGFGPEAYYSPLIPNDDNTTGGFSRIAAIINREKENKEVTTLVLDAGDFLMGTLFQQLEPESGFQLSLMKKMGYDVVCIGNHEFDFGPEKLAKIVSSSAENGELPVILLGNAVFSKKDSLDDSLEDLFRSGKIERKYILTRDEIKIGFFSLLGKVADENAAFAPPVTFSKQIPFARHMVKELKSDGCDLIICMSHSGIDPDKNGGWKGEDVKLAKNVKGIDVIVSGHTHTLLEKPLIVNGIPIVQAGDYGRFVGKLGLILENGRVRVDTGSLIPADDRISGDRVIHDLIQKRIESVNTSILKPLGMDYSKSVAETDFLLECNEMGEVENSNLGPFVADAIHSYVNSHSAPGTDVSMVAAGVIRERILPGLQTSPDIFRVMSMGTGNDNVPGYPLARIYVTGKEMKSILEILNVAWKSTPGNYCYYSGIRVETDPDGGLLKKIKKIELINNEGSVKDVDFSKKNRTLYSITANSYMLQFIGIIKKMSFGLVNVVPKDYRGNKITDMKTAVIDMDDNRNGLQEGKEWLALMEYLGSMKDLNGNGIPDIDKRYRNPVKSFFPVSSK
jgi:5'-nucleotidase / UDP-sugar diphosphatase